MKHLLVTTGPHQGRTLQFEDDVAEVALADKWAVDPTAEGYNAETVEYGSPGNVPQSYQDFIDGKPVQASKQEKPSGKAQKSEAKSSREATTPDTATESKPEGDSTNEHTGDVVENEAPRPRSRR